jgi:nitroreductase
MLDILRNRRSVRLFKKQPVEDDKISVLLEAALRSPSSRGRSPWEFIVVTDPVMLAKLGEAKAHGSSFIAKAPLAIVVAADPSKCDVWVEDCSIAAIIIQLTATSLDLGSCWAQIRLRPHDDKTTAEAYLKDLLDLPEDFVIESVIGVGYPDDELPGHDYDRLLFNQVHNEKYQGPS